MGCCWHARNRSSEEEGGITIAEKLADAVLDLSVDDSKLTKGLKSAESNAGQSAKRMESSFDSAASGMETKVDGAASGMEGSLSGAGAAAERDAQKMEGSFSRAASGIESDMDGAASDVESSMGGLGETAKRAGAVIAGALAVDAVASSFDDSAVAAGRLQSRLGLTSKQAESFDEISKQVYRDNFGESMVEAADTVGLVHQALDLTGNRLKSTTEDVMALSDAFSDQGADSQIIVESIRAMKAAYPGMSEKAIIDQITHAFQQGTGTAGDLQDTLQEYPAHFKAIGLGSKDMMNFLTIGMENGARNTDFLADAVKEFGIRVKTTGDTGQKALQKMFPAEESKRLIDAFAQGGDAGRNAFFKVMRQLSKTSDQQERYNLATQLFGTKAEDMVGVLDKMTPAFLATKNAQDESKGATNSLGDQYTGLRNKIEGIKRIIETSFLGAVGEAGGAVVEFGGSAGMALVGLSTVADTSIGSMVKSLGSSVAAAAKATAATVASIGKQLVAWAVLGAQALAKGAMIAAGWLLAMGPVGLIVIAVAALAALIIAKWDFIKGYLSAAWNWIKDAAVNVWGAIKSFFLKYWRILLVVFTGPLGILIGYIISNWTKIKDFAIGIWGAIKTVIVGFVTALKTGLLAIWGAIKTVIQTYWNLYKTLIITPILSAIEIVRSVIGGVRDWLRRVFGTIADFAKKIWKAIKTAVIEYVRNLRDGLLLVWSAIRTAATTYWQAVKDRIINPIKTAIETVKRVVTAVKSWLSDRWGDIRDKANELWLKVRDRITEPIKTAIETVKRVVADVKSWLSDRWDEIAKRVGGFGTSMKAKLVSAFKSAANAVIGFINSIIGAINKIPGVNIKKIGALASGGTVSSGGVKSGDGVRTFADGGLTTQGGQVTAPALLWGEDAPRYPEWVIPENPQYRTRAIGLLSQAAASLGVPAFAAGGRTPGTGGLSLSGLVGGALDLIVDGAGFITDKLPNPSDYLPGWMSGTGSWVIEKITSWIKEKVQSVLDSIVPGLSGGGGGGYGGLAGLDGWVSSLAHSMGLQTTSGYRPGDDGYHGVNRARDFSNGTATAAELAFGKIMTKFAPILLELIHTPLGYGIKNGQRISSFGAATDADHFDHVHVAMERGGFLERLSGAGFLGSYGSGGVLPADGMYFGHEGEHVGKPPVVNIKLADGMGWLRQFVNVEIVGSDRKAEQVYIAGTGV